jgi:hypothetical protein
MGPFVDVRAALHQVPDDVDEPTPGTLMEGLLGVL